MSVENMVNFIVVEMTFLRYFCPLIEYGNRVGLKSNVFIYPSRKYSCPISVKKNWDQLSVLSNTYEFNVYPIDHINKLPADGVTFLIEGVGAQYLSDKHRKVSLTYMIDFSLAYEKYISQVDHVVLPSYDFAKRFDKVSDKNLYLGSPKYDLLKSKNQVREELDFEKDEKIVLLMYPRLRDIHKINIDLLVSSLKGSGYTVVIKTRGKDPVQKDYGADRCFSDDSWFPHTTLDLISACDFVINTDSTTIKEAILIGRPVVNFKIKPFVSKLGFLHEYDFNVDLNPGEEEKVLQALVELQEHKDLRSEFNNAIQRSLFQPGNVSKHIFEKLSLS